MSISYAPQPTQIPDLLRLAGYALPLGLKPRAEVLGHITQTLKKIDFSPAADGLAELTIRTFLGRDQLLSEKGVLLRFLESAHFPTAKRFYFDCNGSQTVQQLSDFLSREKDVFIKPVRGSYLHGGTAVFRLILDNERFFTLDTNEAVGSKPQSALSKTLTEMLQSLKDNKATELAAERTLTIAPLKDRSSTWEVRFASRYNFDRQEHFIGLDYAKVNKGSRSNIACAGKPQETRLILEEALQCFGGTSADAAELYQNAKQLACQVVKAYGEQLAAALSHCVGQKIPEHLCQPAHAAVDIAFCLINGKIEPVIMEFQYPGAGLSAFTDLFPAHGIIFENSRGECLKAQSLALRELLLS